MMLLVDAGNTRVKWALTDAARGSQVTEASPIRSARACAASRPHG